jgi:LysR family glycine cleavage system transcriptional activator
VVASPWLLKNGPPIRRPEDLAQFTLIEAGDTHNPHVMWVSWQRWFEAQGLKRFEPRRWLYFNYAQQIAQAALTGQGIALARMPLIADSLASGDLVEVLPAMRIPSPLAYWLIVGPRNTARAEIQAFCNWLRSEAVNTRCCIGEMLPQPGSEQDKVAAPAATSVPAARRHRRA